MIALLRRRPDLLPSLAIAFSAALWGLFWLPVVWIQIRVRRLVADGAAEEQYRHLMRWWVALGVPAFVAMLLLFALMVYKPWLYGSLVIRYAAAEL